MHIAADVVTDGGSHLGHAHANLVGGQEDLHRKRRWHQRRIPVRRGSGPVGDAAGGV
jgi:hypothetical protein